MATEQQIKKVQESIIEEVRDLFDSFSWWQAALIGGIVVGGAVSAFLACSGLSASCMAASGGLAAPACLSPG